MRTNWRMALIALLSLTVLSSGSAFGEVLRVDGSILIYDTMGGTADGETLEIDWDHVERIEELLLANPAIDLMQLTSEGGLVGAAHEIADLVIDFELDTHVIGECSSACTVVFLGGKARTMQRGSKLGFHKSSWDAEAIRDFYESERSELGWETPFEFAEWLYEDTQREILDDLRYLLERGVTPGFAIKTLQADTDDMWFPRRQELIQAGVLIE